MFIWIPGILAVVMTMGPSTSDEAERLKTRYDSVPFSTFFTVWHALQKALPTDQRADVLAKMGRQIGKGFDDTGIETLEQFQERLEAFLTREWAITDVAGIELVRDGSGGVVQVAAKQDSCKMCFANTYHKLRDGGTPACMFPSVMMGILTKVRSKFGFKNIRYEGVQKGVVGECRMTWAVA